MAMELVIASNNRNKIDRLRKIIGIIRPDIKLRDISDLNIEPPQENGSNQEENLKIKLTIYNRILNKNIISEDDVIEVKINKKYVLIVKVNDFFKDGNDLYDSWIDYFKKNNITTGRLIKSYGVIINNQIKTAKVIIPLIIKIKKVLKKNSGVNILNNFIGPTEIGRTFNEMSKKERDKYMNELCGPLIKQLVEIDK